MVCHSLQFTLFPVAQQDGIILRLLLLLNGCLQESVNEDVRVAPDGRGEVSVKGNAESVVLILRDVVEPTAAEIAGVLHRFGAHVDEQLVGCQRPLLSSFQGTLSSGLGGLQRDL